MFEKEAEEYCRDKYRTTSVSGYKSIKNAYQKGAEFGYNKANEKLSEIVEIFVSRSYTDDFEMMNAGREIYELFYPDKANVPGTEHKILLDK